MLLVRNLTAGTLKLFRKGKKQDLLPRKVTLVNELDFPADFIKSVYGKFVCILADDDKEPKNVSEKVEEDMGVQENTGVATVADEATDADKESTDTNLEDNDTSAPVEDTTDDAGSSDADGEQESEADEEEAKEPEEKVEEKPKKARKAAGKKKSK